MVNDLNTACKPIHQQIITNSKLLIQQHVDTKIMDLCVEIQQFCMKLQDEIEQIIYSIEYTFLKNNLQTFADIFYTNVVSHLNGKSVVDYCTSYHRKKNLYIILTSKVFVSSAKDIQVLWYIFWQYNHYKRLCQDLHRALGHLVYFAA